MTVERSGWEVDVRAIHKTMHSLTTDVEYIFNPTTRVNYHSVLRILDYFINLNI